MATYSVIAANGVAYGPVDEVGLIRWAHEGRVNANTPLHCHETGVRVMPSMVPALAPVVGLPPQVVTALAQPQTAVVAASAASVQAHMRAAHYQANAKNVGIAYLLWFLCGMFGVHRFYLGSTGSVAAQLCLTLVSIPLMFVVVGIVPFGVVCVWVFVDLFLIPSIAESYNRRLAGWA